MLINISKDIIIPTEKWNEQDWIEKVKPYGITDIVFWEGINVEIDTTKISQQSLFGGNVILKILGGKDEEYLQFGYGSSGKEFNLYHHENPYNVKIIATINIKDPLEELLL